MCAITNAKYAIDMKKNNTAKIMLDGFSHVLFFTVFFSLLFSCSHNVEPQYFNTFFSQPCMIVNVEQDNSIEGHYLVVESIKKIDNTYQLKINLPNHFFINQTNYQNWILGVGNNKPYFDAGVENLWKIDSIDIVNKTVTISDCLRGSNLPIVNQEVVFWNTCPSGFKNDNGKPIINQKKWKGFNGNEIYFGALVFDSILNHYCMIFNEASKTEIQIYAAFSDNLVDWYPANDANPILVPNDFSNTSWAGEDITGEFLQTPYSSDLIFHDEKWYLFLYGFKNGKRQIGLAVSDSTVLGPYKVFNDPIVANGKKRTWDENACLSARVAKYQDGFVMFYNAINRKGVEQLGVAWSSDLIKWRKYEKNPILSNDAAWRSCDKVAEPNYIEIRKDSIFVMVLGAKAFKDGLWYRHISKNAYMDKSGNVDDNQYGFYLSVDGGKTLIPHINNPVFVNDFSNLYENEHLGGGFKYITTDTSDFIFYQAKSSYQNTGYNIMMRERKFK